MDIWDEMYAKANSVRKPRQLSGYLSCGEVSAAVLGKNGKIYLGVCVDTCSSLGLCAERNAIFAMLTDGCDRIGKVLAIMPDGKCGPPCGACRELMMQLGSGSEDTEIMLDYENKKVITLGELCPLWWTKE